MIDFLKQFITEFKARSGAWQPTNTKKKTVENRPSTDELERAERLRQQDGEAGSLSANSHAATQAQEKEER